MKARGICHTTQEEMKVLKKSPGVFRDPFLVGHSRNRGLAVANQSSGSHFPEFSINPVGPE